MSQPLAERMRPKSLDEYIGQKHLVGEGAVLRKMIDSGRVPSFLLWGPPGVGKTTLAQIIANTLDTPFFTLSAINSGVKDVREVIDAAKKNTFFDARNPILFIDEIHRFTKSRIFSSLRASPPEYFNSASVSCRSIFFVLRITSSVMALLSNSKRSAFSSDFKTYT